jgi:hypothetical protein
MKVTRWVPVLLLLSGCAHLGGSPSESLRRARLWDEAHGYFATGAFAKADSVFGHIATTYPETNEGREALFYRGAVSLDPRNPGWDPAPAEQHLQRYLLSDSTGKARIHRRPEGETLYELAHQLNSPMEERIGPLQSTPQRTTVVVTSRASQGAVEENQRLRRDITARDAEIKRLQEELDRIRKTLTGGQ